ncbi:MAG: YbgA family protein, partial [Acidobacteria bacterium]|nr:YbgA family protein [Acidobacteriota bacterium]
PRRHTNVLMHIAGHLKKLLDPASKRELLECIDEYRRELVPLIVPLTLLRHYVRLHDVEYLANQTYLEPHPRELMLRNHV